MFNDFLLDFGMGMMVAVLYGIIPKFNTLLYRISKRCLAVVLKFLIILYEILSYTAVEPLSLERQQFSSTKLISVSIISAFGMVFAGGLILQYFKYSLLKSSVKLLSAEYSLQFFANALAIELESVTGLDDKKLVAYIVI